jgi:hypothetical protein
MAKTYYGYAERLAENQIDWATIGKDLSKALTDEAVIRKTKQIALETSVRETTKKISDAEVGPSSLGNKRLAEYSNNMTQGMQTATRLWKSGQMSTKDYTEFINNVQESNNIVLDLNTSYQDEYKKMMERIDATDPAKRSQMLELFERSEIGEYGTLSNTQYYLDPTSGVVNLAKIKKETIDGQEVVTMGDEFITAMDAKARLQNEYNYFDSEKATTDIADALGTNIIDIREKGGPSSAGIIRSITDPRYRKDLNDEDAKVADLFESVVSQQIAATSSNPLNISSFLTNDVKVDPLTGKAYSYTRDPNKQTSSDIILLKVDSMGRSYPDMSTEMGKKQMQVYNEKMRDKVIMKIDTKEELDTYNEPEPNYGGGGGGGGRGSGNKRKTNSLGITVYENTNNALRTGNLKNLNNEKAKYVFEKSGDKRKQNSILIYEKDPLTGKTTKVVNGKTVPYNVKRIYSADQLAAYVKGVDESKSIPTELYNEGKGDWSYLNDGNYLKGAGYTASDMSGSVYSGSTRKSTTSVNTSKYNTD